MESLDTFRTVSFAADFASERLPPVTVSGGDFKGRVFRLSLTDGGQPTEAEGVQCRLGWNADPGEALGSYVEAARVDGTDTATWEVEVPSSMLAQPRCKAAWMLYTAGTANVLCTLAFDVAVERPVVDTGSAEGEDLVDRLWTAIDTMEQATDNANAATTSAHKAADAAAEAAAAAQATGNVLTAEASGELVNVSDAYPGTLLTTKVYGKSEQVSTTGKNLAYLASEKTNYGITFTPDESKGGVLNGTASTSLWIVVGIANVGFVAGDTLTLSAAKEAALNIWDNANNTAVSAVKNVGSTSVTFTAPSDYLAFVVSNGSGTTFSNVALGLQLELGSTATEYEPYSGGVASPSPEWPQAIESVTSAEVVAAGGNLVVTKEAQATKNGVTYTVNADGSVVLSGTATAATDITLSGSWSSLDGVPPDVCFLSGGLSSNISAGLRYNDASGAYLGAIRDNGNGVKVDFPALGAAGYVATIRVANGAAANATVYPMLNVGTSALPWSPAGTVRHTLDLQGYELRSLPDGTRDELVINADGSYGIVQRVGRVVLDGSETWADYPAEATATKTYYTGVLQQQAKETWSNGTQGAARSSLLQSVDGNVVWWGTAPGFSVDGSGNTVVSTLATSLEEWVATVSEKTMTVDYALATETYIPLGTLDPAPSWPDEGVNNAWTVSDLPTETGVGYIQSAQIVHDRQEARLAALETAIATMEA